VRVLCCGGREWTDRETIRARLKELPRTAIIIHGAARGADSIAGEVATELGHTVEVYPAQWNTYGRAAGPIRNNQMLDTKPDLVIAFHADLSQSKGTAHCIKEAEKRGIIVELVSGPHRRIRS